MRRKNQSKTPVIASLSPTCLHPVMPLIVASQKGRATRLSSGLEKHSATIIPAIMKIATLMMRLRSSRRWSIRGMRPSGLARRCERT